ncbi:MAG: hypothetical protein BWX86_02966 [Verrucomicrobia bacterium ADurb.Bin122]|nr:MAG: hypothetical protein BWX86_02966 [Verrucomicrobia bacterium ADurb.Bin122]
MDQINDARLLLRCVLALQAVNLEQKAGLVLVGCNV